MLNLIFTYPIFKFEITVTAISILLVIFSIPLFLWLNRFFRGKWEVELVGKQIRIKEDRTLTFTARDILVEIQTRKILIGFEEDKDSISEVYNSMYTHFASFRKLLKQLDLTVKNQEKLFNLISTYLNKTLRDHLTMYQKPYREWLNKEQQSKSYENEIKSQKRYKHYDNIISELEIIKIETTKLMKQIKKIAYEKKGETND